MINPVTIKGIAILLVSCLAFFGVMNITNIDGNWIEGNYHEYEFDGKVYPNPSQFGIDKGRISKLTIKKNGKTILNYDRGWDITPKDKTDQEECTKIIQELERKIDKGDLKWKQDNGWSK